MSLFIGNSSSGKAVMHITSGVRTSNQMASGILSDTTFHNGKVFSVFDIVNKTGGTRRFNYFEYRDIDGSNVRVYGYYTASFGAAANAKIGTRDYAALYFLNSANNIIALANVSRIGFSEYLAPGGVYPSGQEYREIRENYGGTYTFPSFVLTSAAEHTNAGMDVFANIAKVLFIENDTTVFGPDGVTIGNGDIVVGGKSMLNFKYVFPGTINNHPSSIQISPGQQLVDASQISGALELVSGQDGTVISKGGYPIITGGLGYQEGTGVITNHTTTVTYTKNTYVSSAVVAIPTNTVIRIKGIEGSNIVLELTNNVQYEIARSTYSISVGTSTYYAAEITYAVSVNGTTYLRTYLDTSAPAYAVPPYSRTYNYTIEVY